jgi:hypothetical protein
MVDKRLILMKLADLSESALVIGLLKKNLSDFDGFKSAIADFIELESQGGRMKSGKKKNPEG